LRLARPLLFALVLVVAFMGWTWLPDPAWPYGSDGPTTARSLPDLVVVFMGPGSPLLALGLLAAWGASGGAGLRAGARYLMGREREGELLAAQGALAAGARAMVSGGLVLGLLGSAAAFLMVGGLYRAGDGPDPGALARLLQWSMLAPLSALGIGRVILGPSADGAAVKAGVPDRRAFRSRDDFMLLLYIVPALMTFAVIIWPVARIQ
jgi:hypothetical protein